MGWLHIYSGRLGVIVAALCYFAFFWRLFTIKMIKSVKVFPFLKDNIFFSLHKNQTTGIMLQNPPSDTTPRTLTLGKSLVRVARPPNFYLWESTTIRNFVFWDVLRKTNLLQTWSYPLVNCQQAHGNTWKKWK